MHLIHPAYASWHSGNFRAAFSRAFCLLVFCGLALLVALSSAMASNKEAEEAHTPPVIFDGRIAGDAKSTRLILGFDREITVRTFYLDQPDRIVLEFTESRVNIPEDGRFAPRGLVSFVRYGAIANGRTRVVLSLANPAKIDATEFAARKTGPGFRYTLDLAVASTEEFSSLVEADKPKDTETAPLAIRGDRVKPAADHADKIHIMIDPGHGGIDGGATGQHGTKEKDLVLAFAVRLKQALETKEAYRVTLTREKDVFLSLKQRLALSQQANPDLFVSIHADSLRQRGVRGSTIYTLSNKASDRLSEELARAENRVDLVAGLAVEEETEAVSDILADLTTRETRQFSKRFSKLLVTNLKDRIKLIKNPQRSAAFGVLKNPEVPGVLLELGYLSNRDDEKLLVSEEWQKKVANVLARTIDQYFAPRLEN